MVDQVTYFFYDNFRISAFGSLYLCTSLLVMLKVSSCHNAVRHTIAIGSRRPLLHRLKSTAALPEVTNEQIVRDHTLPPEDLQSSGRNIAVRSDSSLFSLDGRTVVVTGAGRGLGITLASAVLDAGGDVVCLDVLPQPSKVEWTALAVSEKHRGHATYHQCDITKEEQVRSILTKAAFEAVEREKPIRGLISCAGIQQMVDALDYPVDDFKRILDVNVTGSFVVAKHVAGLMKSANKTGSLVLIASMSGQIANRVRTRVTSADDYS